jgi:hypothetical protein
MLSCVFVLTMLAAVAVQTDNHGIHAVPVPGKVVIDGKLDDWDLSGAVLQCYDTDTLQDVYSGTIAMMHDADAFYLAIHWKDPIPMGNSHDPHYQAAKGWAGDCVQLRVKTDRICHVNAWYSAAVHEPFISIDYGKSLTEPFGGGAKSLFRTNGWKLDEGAELAFLKDADGKGYVQEMKLPWKLITLAKRPVAGERLACGIELLWGEADWPVHRYADNLAEGATSREFFWTALNAWGPVLLEPKGHLTLPVPAYLQAQERESAGPVAIPYTLPRAARVTLAINDATGRRVRNLVPAQPRKKGKNTEYWDGLDDNGLPVPPGKYTYTALSHQGIHANWTMSFCSPGNPTWGTPDGRGAFYGDHTAAQAVAAAGQYVALACPMGEAGQHLIGCDLTGQRLWGLANRVFADGRRISLATDGKLLWIAMDVKSQPYIYRVEIANGRYAPWKLTAKDAAGREYQVLELPVSELTAGDDVNLSAIALRANVLAVALTRENRVDLRDAETGAVLAKLAVDSPRAVAFDADGSLLVLAGDALLRVTRDGKSTTFTAARYPAGYGLAVDAQRNVYLTVRGSEQNVKVFRPDGTPLREIGARGGRPVCGPYNANAMLNPGQPAIDSQGRLWVTEEAKNPKRTSIWSADGALVKELVGTTGYSGAGAINPDDPRMAFAEDTVFAIDLAKGTWRPVYSFGPRNDPADIFPPVAESRSRVMTRDGATYLYTTGTARGCLEVHCTLGKDGAWRSVAHIGIVHRQNAGEYAKYLSPLFEGHDNQPYAWADRNGDGLVQAGELTFAPAAAAWRSSYWGQLPGPDGTIVAFSEKSLLKYPITGYTTCGAPIYDVATPRVVPVEANLLHMGEGMLMAGSGGRTYLNQDPLTAVDDTGKTLFTYPSHHVSVHGSHTAKAARPGYVIGPSSILGTADFGGELGEVFYLNGNLGENYVFTADGLYIQSLFKDCRGGFDTPVQAVRGMSFDATTAGGESFGGNFIRTRDGKVYLVQGGTDARVLELTGFESVKRFSGVFTYTAKQYAAAQALLQQKAAAAQEARAFRVSRAAQPAVIDGKANEWPELLDDRATLLEVRESERQRYGRVQARYDDTNLYLGYRVFANTGRMRNAGQDALLYFKTGDCVDLMLSPSNGVRDAGNLRLLITQTGNQPTGVLYVKSVPGTPAKARVPFGSPWRTIFFDRVEVQPAGVQAATGPIAGGYFVEVAIPWSLLGVKPAAGLKLKGDVGILYADNGGTITVSRQYWCNKNTNLVNDVPGEADLTPNLWGEFTLE